MSRCTALPLWTARRCYAGATAVPEAVVAPLSSRAGTGAAIAAALLPSQRTAQRRLHPLAVGQVGTGAQPAWGVQSRTLFGFGGGGGVLSACKSGDVEKLRAALSDDAAAGPAELNKTDMIGFSGLDHAIASGDPELVEVLVAAKGVQLDGAADKDSPLHAVMAQKDPAAGPRMALALINAGAAVDHPGKKGVTPLHRGLSTGNIPVIKVLLDHGADIDEKSGHGMDAVDWAEALSGRFENTELMDMIVETRRQRWSADPKMAGRLAELEKAKANIGGFTPIDPRYKKPKY